MVVLTKRDVTGIRPVNKGLVLDIGCNLKFKEYRLTVELRLTHHVLVNSCISRKLKDSPI
jgi:hypothetical protein